MAGSESAGDGVQVGASVEGYSIRRRPTPWNILVLHRAHDIRLEVQRIECGESPINCHWLVEVGVRAR